MKSTALFLFACLLAATGCAETRTYQVSVHNNTPEPVTLWLFKDGGPYENGWKSPDDIAIESPKANEPIGGIIVPAGKTATAGPVQGKFNGDTHAILRVYRGAHSFNELLAISQASGERKDIPLPKGASDFVVSDSDAKLHIDPVGRRPQTP